MRVSHDPEKFLKTLHTLIGKGDLLTRTGCFATCPFDTDEDAIKYAQERIARVYHFARRTEEQPLLRWYEHMILSATILRCLRACYAAKELAFTEWLIPPSEVPYARRNSNGVLFYAQAAHDCLVKPTVSEDDVNRAAVNLYRLYHAHRRTQAFFDALISAKINDQKQVWEHSDVDKREYNYHMSKVPVDKMW